MAMKDFKKVINEKEFIRYDTQKGKLISVWVVKRNTTEGIRWVFEAVEEGEIPPRAKLFKTKPQALAYARSYMRSH